MNARPSRDDMRADGKTQSSSDIIYNNIIQGLYSGRYSPGQRLVEADLSNSFGLSRGTVREALKRLTSEGVATIIPHRGASIRLLSRSEAIEALLVIEVLQGLAARLAAQNIDRFSNRDEVKGAFRELTKAQAGSDFIDQVRARNRFHRTLIKASGNRELHRLLRGFSLHLLRVQFRMHGIESGAQPESYKAITDAILAGNSAKAEKAAIQHVQATLEKVVALPESAFARETPASDW